MKRFFLVFLVMGASVWGTDVTKAVFDCASKEMKYVSSRMFLIEETAKELQAANRPYDFVLTVHSGCTPIVTDETGDDEIKKGISQRLKKLSRQYHVKIEACEIAMDRFGIEKSDLPGHIGSVRNSITRVIELQNNGYAFIPYH